VEVEVIGTGFDQFDFDFGESFFQLRAAELASDSSASIVDIPLGSHLLSWLRTGQTP
jgi:hypothetical protein